MSDMYNRIYELCQKKGISIGKMCNELRISRGNLTELKMGRIKTLKAENLKKISGYFGVTVDYILDTNVEKAPTPEDERKITFDDFSFAMHGFSGNLTEENKKSLLSMAEQLAEANKRKNQNGETD